jgi:acyl phosphate:glycerol-3-phosphate acyltransferase
MPACAALCGFVIGSIPCSWILARLAGGLDIRTVGSGNVGATNVARALGYGHGVVALLLDAAKGGAAVLVGRALGSGDPVGLEAILAGGMSVVGHSFSPFLGFRGGKGVATGAGVFAMLAPWVLLPGAAVFAVTVTVTRMVSLASILAAAALPIAAAVEGAGAGVIVLALMVAAFVILRHHENLRRIFDGSERRIGGRGPA